MALGSIVDAVLSRILNDILALSDIPEVESHRLSELCRILSALEALFVEDSNHVRPPPSLMYCVLRKHTTQPSFVVAYVPSWLKFSYLSELLVSIHMSTLWYSMLNITYRKLPLLIFRTCLKRKRSLTSKSKNWSNW